MFLEIIDENGEPRLIAVSTITEILPAKDDPTKTLIRRGKSATITAKQSLNTIRKMLEGALL